ncbi:ankyrin repeat-containing domain protein [Xylariaceae sp. AK1471]|nr:ankyrin repeat-containing domain protein [Xylariaceae sp. AK1471]
MVKLLIDRGADVSATDTNGNTPLYEASSSNENVRITKFKDGSTLLHVSVRGSIEMAKLLIDRGADPSAANKDGSTPSHRAAIFPDSIEMVKLLIDYGANVSAVNKYRETPLHWASSKEDIEVAKLLIDRGVDVLAADKNGWTPLYKASSSNNIEMVKLLIDCGADVPAATSNGKTLLEMNLSCGNIKIAKLLVDCGAHIPATNEDRTIDLSSKFKREWAITYIALAPQGDAFLSGDTAVALFYLGESDTQQAHDRSETQETVFVLSEKQYLNFVFCLRHAEMPAKEENIDLVAYKLASDGLQIDDLLMSLETSCFVIPVSSTGRRGTWYSEQSLKACGGSGTYITRNEAGRERLMRDLKRSVLRRLLSYVAPANQHLQPTTILLSELIKNAVRK